MIEINKIVFGKIVLVVLVKEISTSMRIRKGYLNLWINKSNLRLFQNGARRKKQKKSANDFHWVGALAIDKQLGKLCFTLHELK